MEILMLIFSIIYGIVSFLMLLFISMDYSYKTVKSVDILGKHSTFWNFQYFIPYTKTIYGNDKPGTVYNTIQWIFIPYIKIPMHIVGMNYIKNIKQVESWIKEDESDEKINAWLDTVINHKSLIHSLTGNNN